MNPAKIYENLVATGTAMAEARYEYEQLDSQTKSILALLTLEAKEVEEVGSMAEATQIALSSSFYRDHLRSVVAARLAYGKAEVLYKASDSLFQAQRTVESSERAALHAAT